MSTKVFNTKQAAYNRRGMFPKGSGSETVVPYVNGYAIYDKSKGFYQVDRTWQR